MQKKKFETWAVVSQLGHTQYAGYLTEEEVAGKLYLKISVPPIENHHVKLPQFEKYLSHDSIFEILPVSEEYARRYAKELSMQPINGYKHEQVLKDLAQKMFDSMKLEQVKQLLSDYANTEGASKIGSTESDFPI